MMRLILTFAAIAGIAAQTPPPDLRADLLVAGADLARQLKDPALVVLHVADRESSFTDGHIPGARFVRYGDFAVEGDSGVGSELPQPAVLKRVFEAAGVSDSSRVVIYGASTVAAARAFFTLDAAGHRKVALLDGGLMAWNAEKRPLETGAARPVARGTFTPTPSATRIADAAFVQKQLATSGIALLDIRPDAEYFGTDGGMGGRHTPGHIAGARQLPWNTLVGEDGRFLAPTELEARFRAAGVATGKPVVTYCMVGMRASVAYFVARYLGYDARLYDGSIIDWTQRKLPTTTGRQ
jgi:thiosulfate/3-mercaptopyruvate sulfurtransferase